MHRFWGPAAHIALMENEVVRKKKQLSHDHFLDLIITLVLIIVLTITKYYLSSSFNFTFINLISSRWLEIISCWSF